MMETDCLELSKTYLQLKPSGKAKTWVAQEFWEAMKTGKGVEAPFGYLVAQYDFSKNWNHWECHPKGDELLIAVEGSMELILEIEGKERLVSLVTPNSFLIPTGTWHTANVSKSCRIIGISAGDGTQSRPRT
jgi:mannose-6-phosphate isomerase-like protein (cupin superfamily)